MNYQELIKETAKQVGQNFSSWDLAKCIKNVKGGVEIRFFVCHKDEIETEDIIDLHNFGKALIDNLSKVEGAKLVDKGIFLPNLDKYQVEEDFIEICQEEYVSLFGEKDDNPNYSFSIELM